MAYVPVVPQERREELGLGGPRAPGPWLVWSAVAALAVAAAVTAYRDGRPHRPARPPSPAASGPAVVAGPPWGLVPPTQTDGGRTRMPVVFPDGSSAVLSYPAALGLARLGVRPHITGWLGTRRTTCCVRPILAPPVGDAWFATGGAPAVWFADAEGGRVEMAPPPRGGPQSAFLLFSFGRWRVGVQRDRDDAMDDRRARTWAAGLRGHVTREGFLVLRGTGALRLGAPEDDGLTNGRWSNPRPHAGAQLRFGRGLMAAYTMGEFSDPVVIVELVRHCRNFAATAGYLDVGVSDTACKGPSIRIWAGGDRGFVRAVLADVRVSKVRLAAR